jgi:nucleoside 2-deoxyribosyltransferase
MQIAKAQPQSNQRGEARRMKIYMAGPLGFSEAGRSFHAQVLVPKVKSLGYEVFDPWDPPAELKAKIDAVLKMPYGPARRDAWQKVNIELGANNRTSIDQCDSILAVLDGVDVDSGTAAEIGYAFARGKPILGYRGDFRLSADNEGSSVNLQVEYLSARAVEILCRASPRSIMRYHSFQSLARELHAFCSLEIEVPRNQVIKNGSHKHSECCEGSERLRMFFLGAERYRK